MIKSEKTRRGYVNEATEYLDLHLIGKTDMYWSYIEDDFIYDKSVEGTFSCGIKTPGATRGSLRINKGVIESIELFEDSFCFDRAVLDNLNQFKGIPGGI